MTIVQKYGRKPNYLFENDEKLALIMKGNYGPKAKATKNQVTCALDSFLTIFLITLPEKFKQWYKFHNSGFQEGNFSPTKLVLSQTPMFTKYLKDSEFTRLSPCPPSDKYDYLPETWNLLECFDYYLYQHSRWTTPSIEAELDCLNNNVEVNPYPSSDEVQEDDEERDTKVDDQDKQEAQEIGSEHEGELIVNNQNKD